MYVYTAWKSLAMVWCKVPSLSESNAADQIRLMLRTAHGHRVCANRALLTQPLTSTTSENVSLTGGGIVLSTTTNTRPLLYLLGTPIYSLNTRIQLADHTSTLGDPMAMTDSCRPRSSAEYAITVAKPYPRSPKTCFLHAARSTLVPDSHLQLRDDGRPLSLCN